MESIIWSNHWSVNNVVSWPWDFRIDIVFCMGSKGSAWLVSLRFNCSYIKHIPNDSQINGTTH